MINTAMSSLRRFFGLKRNVHASKQIEETIPIPMNEAPDWACLYIKTKDGWPDGRYLVAKKNENNEWKYDLDLLSEVAGRSHKYDTADYYRVAMAQNVKAVIEILRRTDVIDGR